MNPNQNISTVARIAPPLALIMLAGFAIKSLFFGESTETKSKIKPAIVPPSNLPVLPIYASATLKPSVPVSENFPEIPRPQKRRVVLREDLAKIFQYGKRSMYRIDAIAELQKGGFGKTAAYNALLPSGKFAGWLSVAPDGIISWKE